MEQIRELPTEMKHYILSFIGREDMQHVKLVNRDFYSRCSAILNKEKSSLTIDLEKLNDAAIVESMKYTLRRFSSLVIRVEDFTPEQIQAISDILDNIGESVERFYLNAVGRSVKVYQSPIIKWLNMMPNVTSIASGGLFGCEEILDDPHTVLKLDKLDSVQLCPLTLGTKLHQIPTSTITFLQFNDRVPLPNVDAIFERHGATLERLDLFRPVFTDPKPFRHLQLLRLACLYQEYMNNTEHDEFLMDVVEHQNQMNTLVLGECDLCSNCYPVSSQLLRKICTKAELNELALGFSSRVTAMDVYELRKLINLEELTIQMHFDTYNNDNVSLIEILCSTGLPNLQSLRMLTNFGSLSLNMFLDSFPMLSSLELSESLYTFNAGRKYENMVCLALRSDFGDIIDIHPCLIKSMPHLNELSVDLMFPRVSTFRAIFKSKISTLEIAVAKVETLSVHKMRKIKKICKKLQRKCIDCAIDFEDESDED